VKKKLEEFGVPKLGMEKHRVIHLLFVVVIIADTTGNLLILIGICN
jgi:hypothetical protein